MRVFCDTFKPLTLFIKFLNNIILSIDSTKGTAEEVQKNLYKNANKRKLKISISLKLNLKNIRRHL